MLGLISALSLVFLGTALQADIAWPQEHAGAGAPQGGVKHKRPTGKGQTLNRRVLLAMT